MAKSNATRAGGYTTPRRFGPIFRFLASLKLAVILMLVLASVLSVATLLETKHGMAYSHWYVYKSSWFSALLGLLGVNIFTAAAVRFPWKRHQTGFVITHAGLLVLLAGAIQSFLRGVEGQISIVEGEMVSKLTLPDRSQITALWEERPHEAPYEFSFDGGPVDWNAKQALDIGEVDGVSARILRFFRHAKPVSEWVATAEGGGPLVRFRLSGPGGKVIAEHYLADERFGDALLVGPIRVQLQRTLDNGMLDDFLEAAAPDPDGDGLLTVYYQDAVERVPVTGNVGKRIAIGRTDAFLEIVEYLPNARPDKMGRFVSKGDQPTNPMLELRVYVPGAEEPFRQIAFAKDALLNLDGVYARDCPVKFRYRHGAVKPETAVEFLQASDGKLYCRTSCEGQLTPRGVMSAGGTVPIAHNFELTVTEYLPHAENRLSFEAAAADDRNGPESAVLVEIHSAAATQQAWLQRNDLHYGTRKVFMPGGALLLRYGYGQVPLGFALTLEDFRREFNPGREGDAAFASTVRVVDEEEESDDVREISMNQPLTHRGLTFYQSGFNESGHGKEASVLNVAYDPGRPLKYAGSLMISMGIAVMFYMRAYFFKRARGGTPEISAHLAPTPAVPERRVVDAVTTPNEYQRRPAA